MMIEGTMSRSHACHPHAPRGIKTAKRRFASSGSATGHFAGSQCTLPALQIFSLTHIGYFFFSFFFTQRRTLARLVTCCRRTEHPASRSLTAALRSFKPGTL